MKQKFMQWWYDLTLWSLARRREWRDCPDDNDLVYAILLRRAEEDGHAPGKDGPIGGHRGQ